jgi:hypothetical protein
MSPDQSLTDEAARRTRHSRDAAFAWCVVAILAASLPAIAEEPEVTEPDPPREVEVVNEEPIAFDITYAAPAPKSPTIAVPAPQAAPPAAAPGAVTTTTPNPPARQPAHAKEAPAKEPEGLTGDATIQTPHSEAPADDRAREQARDGLVMGLKGKDLDDEAKKRKRKSEPLPAKPNPRVGGAAED